MLTRKPLPKINKPRHFWKCPACESGQYAPLNLVVYSCKHPMCNWQGDRDRLLRAEVSDGDFLV